MLSGVTDALNGTNEWKSHLENAYLTAVSCIPRRSSHQAARGSRSQPVTTDLSGHLLDRAQRGERMEVRTGGPNSLSEESEITPSSNQLVVPGRHCDRKLSMVCTLLTMKILYAKPWCFMLRERKPYD